jgi:hypothetical protein
MVETAADTSAFDRVPLDRISASGLHNAYDRSKSKSISSESTEHEYAQHLADLSAAGRLSAGQ